MGAWDAWIGREARRSDRLDAALAARFLASFDLPALAGDGPLPQGVHLVLCTPDDATARLGDDGHPLRSDAADSVLPPLPLPRRMWAGSGIVFHRPIALGAAVDRVSRVLSITEKGGSSGRLVFVDIAHDTFADGALAVAEQQTLVYREAAPADAPLSPADPTGAAFDASDWDAHRVVVPDARLLFRYSALTFNSHRIHYDLPYARVVERYRGLLVHGPLIASLLLQMAATRWGDNRLARFSFRGVSPAIAGEPLHLVMRGAGDALQLAAFAGDGRQVTRAEGALDTIVTGRTKA